MNSKKTPRNRSPREAKKAIVLYSDKKNQVPIVIAAAVVIAAAAGLGLFLFPGIDSPTIPVADAPSSPLAAADGRFTFAVSLFDDGKARHFDFVDAENNTTIRYFLLKSIDGVVRAAFDACDVCWPEGKGYVQEDNVSIQVNRTLCEITIY